MSALQDSQEALEDYAKYFLSMSTNELSRPSTMVRPIRIEPIIEEASVLADRVFTVARIFNILEDVPWNKAAGKSGVGYDLIKAADFSVISLVARWFRGLYRIVLVQYYSTCACLILALVPLHPCKFHDFFGQRRSHE